MHNTKKIFAYIQKRVCTNKAARQLFCLSLVLFSRIKLSATNTTITTSTTLTTTATAPFTATSVSAGATAATGATTATSAAAAATNTSSTTVPLPKLMQTSGFYDCDQKLPYCHQQCQGDSCPNWLCKRFAALESMAHKPQLPSLVEATTQHQSSSVSKGKVSGSG